MSRAGALVATRYGTGAHGIVRLETSSRPSRARLVHALPWMPALHVARVGSCLTIGRFPPLTLLAPHAINPTELVGIGNGASTSSGEGVTDEHSTTRRPHLARDVRAGPADHHRVERRAAHPEDAPCRVRR